MIRLFECLTFGRQWQCSSKACAIGRYWRGGEVSAASQAAALPGKAMSARAMLSERYLPASLRPSHEVLRLLRVLVLHGRHSQHRRALFVSRVHQCKPGVCVCVCSFLICLFLFANNIWVLMDSFTILPTWLTDYISVCPLGLTVLWFSWQCITACVHVVLRLNYFQSSFSSLHLVYSSAALGLQMTMLLFVRAGNVFTALWLLSHMSGFACQCVVCRDIVEGLGQRSKQTLTGESIRRLTDFASGQSYSAYHSTVCAWYLLPGGFFFEILHVSG